MIKKKIRETITRKRLYELVWSKPIMDIAKEFGISDRGLGKVCERYDIPKPPRGYWQKLAAGEKIKIPKLPEIKDQWRENITIEGTVEAEISNSLSEKIVDQTTEQIVVPSRLSKTHPLVKDTEKSVRKELRYRRNLILNSLFLELEKQDYQIEIEEGYFKISLEKERLYLKISEHHKESKRPLTEKEEKNKSYSFQKWVYEYEETGKLKLSLHEWIPAYYSSALIRSFIDLKDKLIETKINEIYLTIIEYLLSKREKTLKDEKERKLRKEREKQERIRKKKQEIIIEETENFLLAKNIREYVESKEKSFKAGKVKMIDFEEWKIFALNYADEIDSSYKNEEEVIDDYKEYDWY